MKTIWGWLKKTEEKDIKNAFAHALEKAERKEKENATIDPTGPAIVGAGIHGNKTKLHQKKTITNNPDGGHEEGHAAGLQTGRG